MKIRTLSIAIGLLSVISCDFRKSVSKDLVTGMVTKGDGLSSEDVYLTTGDETIQRNTFTYGEELSLSFNNIEGFERIDNHVFPGMSLIVISENGDTVLKNLDLYAGLASGTDHSPLLLTSEVTVADPIHSNGEYTLFVNIWDKKGDGVFTAELDFDVVPNDQIDIECNHITYREIYLYSQQRQRVITNNTAGFNENVFMMFEGLEGFVKEGEMISIGLSLTVKDSEGNLIVNEGDLMDASGMDYSEVHSQLAPNFILTGSQINNPVECEINIWDKKGEGSIKTSTQLQIE